MVSSEDYYDAIAEGYDSLHKEEQLKKILLVKKSGIIEPEDVTLDVGCGTGFSLDELGVKDIVGIEPSQGLISQYSGSKKILKGRAEDLPFDDSSFDLVVSFTAIQNFDDVRKGLLEIKRVGRYKFALTVLKKSPKINLVMREIENIFSENLGVEEIEEDKDIIFIIR